MPASEPARSEEWFPAGRARVTRVSDRTPDAVALPYGELGLVTRDLGQRLRADTALVARWDVSEQSVEVVSAWSAAADLEDGHDHLAHPKGRGFVGRVLASGHAAVEPIEPGIDHGLGAPASETRLTHAAGAPVRFPGGRAGALCAGFSGIPPGEPDVTLWIVESYARLAALCLHDPGVLDGLFEASRRDGLTGCLNYESAREELIREISRSARHGLRLSCCFIDLDGFKGVNDRLGHVEANKVLADAASALAGAVRGSDTLGRFGGDEFVVILPETGKAEACTLAERLRSKFADATRQLAGETLDASIGVAEWLAGTSADVVLDDADRALRAAKAAGGGAVIAEGDAHGFLSRVKDRA